MSLRDRLRHRGPGDADGAGRDAVDGDRGGDRIAAEPSVPRENITDFHPHSDGDYRCAERGLFLRFARPAVTETVQGSATAADGAPLDPARGEFTQSGRFVVQRRFDRPVVYTVLEHREDSIVVRRTDTSVSGPAGTEELEFTFVPDGR